jgi:para-aminobenzoate synthetase
MAIAHKSLPYYGVQYHPESIGTAYGHELLKNFKEITVGYHLNRQQEHAVVSNGEGELDSIPSETFDDNTKGIGFESKNLNIKLLPKQQLSSLQVLFKEVPGVLIKHDPHLTAQTIFDAIVLQENSASTSAIEDSAVLLQDTFWLDTAAVDRGRFSFMGSRGGALWRRINYKLLGSNCNNYLETISGTRERENYSSIPTSPNAKIKSIGGVLTSIDNNGSIQSTGESSFWDWLNAELRSWRVSNGVENQKEGSSVLPFDFCGGLIGYLGYELKADGCGGKAAHVSTTPDATLFLVDQFIALDHKTGSVYAVAVHSEDKGDAEASSEKIETERWIETTAEQIKQLKARFTAENNDVSEVVPHQNGNFTTSAKITAPSLAPSFHLREPKAHYIKNVKSCMEALYAGDSYELCLTTEMRRPSTWDATEAWALYKILRKVNPAPYAAWLQFGGGGGESSSISICCSSPERFLKGDKTGGLEAKPIKGTAKRHANATPEEDAAAAAALVSSEKDRAENLMIVDLLRNDLGRVCDPGTVHVPTLMNIESFATVHQLVSTVRGHRRKDASVAEAVRAAFPGGSMTGAPKVRSMEIIDQLENGPRGVYSGSLGYFSFNGTFDLNIVIRTAVVHDGVVRIGAGGAIVVQSEAEAEYDEMQLKAVALMDAVAKCDAELELLK